MPIPIVGIAPLNGWRQVGAPHWIVMGQHRFEATRDHQLAHYTDDVLRAVVPPEGWAEYVKLWPDAQLLLDQLGRAHAERQAAQAQAREQTKGSELVEMENPGRCCGFGGVMRVAHLGLSDRIGDAKAQEIIATGVGVVVTGCPGCRMQLADSLRRAGSKAEVVHTVQVLDAALRRREAKKKEAVKAGR